ncbi:50S ribosomal protein L13 [Candidatus Beckwithbacteria bacterium]|nr:50S ribosomal protein L13 [Candidatus Beckwithbacteria bacterium]
MTTTATKKTDIKRTWHVIDLKHQVLGRASTQIAELLIGKHKSCFNAHVDCGDYVVAINAAKVEVTGRKAKQKMYYSHSGFPGGFKEVNYTQQMVKDPRKIIEHAISGMLPKNKLKKDRMKRLRIFVDDKHPYADKLEK